MQGIALEFDANNAPIEILEQQIKELRANRSNIKQQLLSIQNETDFCSSDYLKIELEKIIIDNKIVDANVERLKSKTRLCGEYLE
jgi:DNA repair exonuclease SbcCD ATPase subunit